MSNTKILVTGAGGFIGSHILAQLVKDGFDCIAISRDDQAPLNNVQWIKADLLEPLEYESCLEKVNLIVHAAGFVSFQKKDKARLLLDNHVATKTLVDFALKYNVPGILYISTASALIRSGNPNLISTQCNGNPVFESFYAKTKFHAELEIRLAEAEGMKVCILNAGYVIGMDKGNGITKQLFEKVNRGISHYPPGNLGLVSIQDLVSFVSKFCKNELRDTQILVNAEVWTFQDFLNEIAVQLGRKKIEKQASLFTARLLDYWESLFQKETSLITGENLKNCFKQYAYDNAKSKDSGDFKYMPIRPLIREIATSMTK